MAWPFPDARIARVAERARALVVPEINLGQMVREVERAAHGMARVVAVSHAGGHYPAPDALLAAIARNRGQTTFMCCQVRLLALGGGGYSLENLAEAWCEVVAAMLEAEEVRESGV